MPGGGGWQRLVHFKVFDVGLHLKGRVEKLVKDQIQIFMASQQSVPVQSRRLAARPATTCRASHPALIPPAHSIRRPSVNRHTCQPLQPPVPPASQSASHPPTQEGLDELLRVQLPRPVRVRAVELGLDPPQDVLWAEKNGPKVGERAG